MSFSVSNQNGSQQSQIRSQIASLIQTDKAAGKSQDQIRSDVQALFAQLGIHPGQHKGKGKHHGAPSPEIQQLIQEAAQYGIDSKSFLKNHDVTGLQNAIAQAQSKQQNGGTTSNPFAGTTVGLSSSSQPPSPSILGQQLSGIA